MVFHMLVQTSPVKLLLAMFTQASQLELRLWGSRSAFSASAWMVVRVPTTFHLYTRVLEGAKLRTSSRKRRFDRRSKEGDTLWDLLSPPRERRFIWLRTPFRKEAGSHSCSGRLGCRGLMQVTCCGLLRLRLALRLCPARPPGGPGLLHNASRYLTEHCFFTLNSTRVRIA